MNKHTTDNNTVAEWEQERFKMAQEIFKNVLDPLTLFAEMVRKCAEGKNAEYDFLHSEIASMLRLIVLGGYTDVKACCTGFEGPILPTTLGFAKQIDEEWEDLLARLAEKKSDKK